MTTVPPTVPSDRLVLLHRAWAIGYYLRRVGSMSGVRNAADKLCVQLAHMRDDDPELATRAHDVHVLCDIATRFLPVAGNA